MTKIFLSYPRSSIEFFRFIASQLTGKGYVVTNDFGSQEYLSFTGENLSSVNSQIFLADFVVAVDVRSDAVLFELGIAYGMSKKIIIMERDETDIPPFLKDFYYLRWKDSTFVAEILDHFIQANVKSGVSQKPNIEYSTLRDLLTVSNDSVSILDNVSPVEFEKLVANYFVSNDFTVESNKSSYDPGYDFTLLNYGGYSKTLVEIKKYSSNQKVSITPIQQLLGAMLAYKADHGILITSSEFTKSAVSFAQRLDNHKLELWDIERLRVEVSRF